MSPVWAVSAVDGINMETHEDNVRPVVESLFPTGGVFVDIGAHLGLYTVTLGARASKVVAVEPNPDIAAVLRQNIQLNGLEGVVTVLELAAWDRYENLASDNPSPSDPNDKLSGWMRVIQVADGAVTGRRLDDVLPRLDQLDLVKVDTEGSDLRALRGMVQHLMVFKPTLFVESHEHLAYGYSFEDMYETLESLGYGWEPGPTWMGSHHFICRPL